MMCSLPSLFIPGLIFRLTILNGRVSAKGLPCWQFDRFFQLDLTTKFTDLEPLAFKYSLTSDLTLEFD